MSHVKLISESHASHMQVTRKSHAGEYLRWVSAERGSAGCLPCLGACTPPARPGSPSPRPSTTSARQTSPNAGQDTARCPKQEQQDVRTGHMETRRTGSRAAWVWGPLLPVISTNCTAMHEAHLSLTCGIPHEYYAIFRQPFPMLWPALPRI